MSKISLYFGPFFGYYSWQSTLNQQYSNQGNKIATVIKLLSFYSNCCTSRSMHLISKLGTLAMMTTQNLSSCDYFAGADSIASTVTTSECAIPNLQN